MRRTPTAAAAVQPATPDQRMTVTAPVRLWGIGPPGKITPRVY
jgi:hypothetical protein